MGEKRTHLTHKQRFDLAKLLEQNLVQGEDGFCSYKEGVNDAFLATQFDVSTSTVAKLRVELFGEMRRAKGEDKLDALQQRIAVLEHNYTLLQAEHTRLKGDAEVAFNLTRELERRFDAAQLADKFKVTPR